MIEMATVTTTTAYVHPTSLVETDAIGAGTRIWAFTHIGTNVVVGANCNIGSHCYLESGVRVGDGATIKNGNCIWSGITLGNGVFIGPRVAFTNDLRPRSPRLPQAKERYSSDAWLSPTDIEQGASVGAGAVILAGISLKRFCMVAAGAVVTRSVPPHAMVMGMPARIAGWVCCCGGKLPFDHVQHSHAGCGECGSHFEYLSQTTGLLLASGDEISTELQHR